MISAMSDQSDGLVLCSPRTPTEHLAHLALGQRTVLVNRRLDGVASVTVDHLSGIHQALAHLRALGHHRIGYVGGPITSWSEHQRRRGLSTGRG